MCKATRIREDLGSWAPIRGVLKFCIRYKYATAGVGSGIIHYLLKAYTYSPVNRTGSHQTEAERDRQTKTEIETERERVRDSVRLRDSYEKKKGGGGREKETGRQTDDVPDIFLFLMDMKGVMTLTSSFF